MIIIFIYSLKFVCVKLQVAQSF